MEVAKVKCERDSSAERRQLARENACLQLRDALDVYRAVVSENGRAKLGHPLMACFNSCVAMIAKDMGTLPPDDVIDIVVERGGGSDDEAVETFERMKVNLLVFHTDNACSPVLR
jgi:hypothetical protein